MTLEELSALEETEGFSEVPETTKRAIYEECSKLLVGPFMEQAVCSVCDSWVRKQNCPFRDHDEDLYRRCQSRLRPSADLPIDLKFQYDISNYIPLLKDVLLSKRGVTTLKNKFYIRVCDTCYKSLKRGSIKEGINPPKFSIANGFAIGELPTYLKDVTFTERRLTSLTNIKGHTVIARGGKHRFIKIHFLVFSSQPDIIQKGINELVRDEDKLLLIFTNPMTEAQRRATMKRFEARKVKIDDLLSFYLRNNILYQALDRNGRERNRLGSVSRQSQIELDYVNTVYTIDSLNAAEELSENQSNIRRPTVFDTAQNDREETIIRQDSSLFTCEDATEPVTALKMATAKIIDIQQAGKYLPANSPNFFGRLFPHLFPFGYGLPDSHRKVNVSLHECIKHYLRLSSRYFAQDETFPLVSFDIVSRKRAMSSISLTCRLNPNEIEELNEVSASDLAAQVEQEAKKRDMLKNGCIYNEKPKSRSGKRLLRRVQAVLGKSFATNEERKIYQRKAWSMAAKYHSAAMFITVTPNENGNATVAFYAGDINKENLSDITENDIPCNASRIEIAGRDPVACDLFFTNILEILIGTMIGFDMKTKLPRKQGGLFGVPLAFMGGIESQGKGTLHVHLIVFLAGFPKDTNELLNLMKTDEAFQKRILSFFDSVTQSSVVDTDKEFECPTCKSRGTLKPVKISKIAYTANMRFDSPPQTSMCRNCRQGFAADEVIRHRLKMMKEDLFESDIEKCFDENLCDQFLESNHNNDNQVAVKAAVPNLPALTTNEDSYKNILKHRIFFIELILLNQNHRWKHAKSCFKRSSNCRKGCCRHNFPRLVRFLTEMDDIGTISGKRDVGSEYINSFNSIMLQVIRSNHDVRFLLCCAHEIFYTIKYVVKDQNSIDNIAAITITSYTRRLEREKEKNKDISKSQTVYGRIASMAYARSELVEVGAVTAVHYLLHGTTFVCSHDFQSLHLGRHLNDLDEVEGDIGLVPFRGSYLPFDVSMNYKLRPLELESECLYDYTEMFFLSRDIPKDIDKNLNCMRLHPEHPFYPTKVVKRHKTKVVADIIGPRIPDLYEITEENMEKYSKIALLLFKPHRNKKDILGKFETFTEAFNDFKNCAQYSISQSGKILSNMQQYYVGKRRAQQIRSENLEKWQEENEDQSEISDASDHESVPLEDCDDWQEEKDSSIDFKSYSSHLDPRTVQNVLENIVDNISKRKLRQESTSHTKNKIMCSVNEMKSVVKRNLRKSKNRDENINESYRWPTQGNGNDEKCCIRLYVKDVAAAYKSILSSELSSPATNDAKLRTISLSSETIVRLLEDAVKSKLRSEYVQNDNTCTEKFSTIINPTLDQVSKVFTLNERQDIAFRIGGAYLLDSFKRSLLKSTPGKPLRMHLSGEGGTGKSRVIDALRFLAERWGKPDSVVTVAPTGIAAVLVKGETVHSKLQLFQNKKPTIGQLEQWAKVHMLIWDEISMTGQCLFSRAMKKIKAFLSTDAGCDARIHIVTAGDFAQLPPCFEKFIFTSPALIEVDHFDRKETSKGSDNLISQKTKNAKINNITGFHIWQSFTTVIKLTENMRHIHDPFYGNILKRLRTGDQTFEDFEILNSRYLDMSKPNSKILRQFNERKKLNAVFPIAVQSNTSRHSINWLSASEISKTTSTEAIPIICPAIFKSTSRGAKLSKEEIVCLFRLGDNKLQRLSPLLPIFPGMPVYITQNIGPKIGLANGSTGFVVGCQFPEDTVFNSIHIKGAPMKIASTIPDIVFVSVDQATLHCRFPDVPEFYPDNTIPVLPVTASVRVTCLAHRSFTIKITQIPICPSFSATTHKLQGTTCDSIISYIFNEQARQSTSLYVLASRVKTLNGLFLCQKLTQEDFEFFRPSKDVLKEERRLDVLCQKTLQNFSSGNLFPIEENENMQKNDSGYEINTEDEEIDLYPPRKEFKPEEVTPLSESKLKKTSSKNFSIHRRISPFNSLLPNFNLGTVRRMRIVQGELEGCDSGEISLPFSSFANVQIVPHLTLWTIADVPGDGNCWIYATVISIYYCNLRLGNSLCLDPQECRNKICSLLFEVSNLDERTRADFLRNMNLFASQRGHLLEELSVSLGYRNSLHMMSSFLKIGTPNSCLWAADIGEELNLLALVLNQSITCYTLSSEIRNSSPLGINSTIGRLRLTSVYDPYPNSTPSRPIVPFKIPILFSGGNHFQALIPPLTFDIQSLIY